MVRVSDLKVFLSVTTLCIVSPVATAEKGAAEPCGETEIAKLCETAVAGNDSVELHCDINFSELDCQALGLPNVITKRMRFIGEKSSHISVDLAGAHVNAGSGTYNYQRGDIVEFVSVKQDDGSWSVPTHSVFKNARITGSLRLYGLGKNGEAPLVKASSHTNRHIETVRKYAPSQIFLDRLVINGIGRTPLYLAPGVNKVSLTRSVITGRSIRVGIYLDAESFENVISDNLISVKTDDGSILGFYDRGWPQIALDASSGNLLQRNRFDQLQQGGIYLYRNCGEGGTIRHGSPSSNIIRDNDFIYRLDEPDSKAADPAILIGSRDYGSFENRWPGTHCDDDEAAGLKVGSAISNRDYATDNIVNNNRVQLHQLVGMPRLPKGYSLRDRLQIRNLRINRNNILEGNSVQIYRADHATHND